MPAFAEEAWMPPAHDIQLSLLLYYMESVHAPKHFWTHTIMRLETKLQPWTSELVEQAVAAVAEHRDAPLMRRLQVAYSWIQTNVQQPTLSAIDPRAQDQTTGSTTDQLDALFLHLARKLGAEARVGLAPDRRRHYWDSQIMIRDHLDTTMVTVREKGTSDDEAILVDPSSGRKVY